MRERMAMHDMTVAALTFALSAGLAAAQEPAIHEAHSEEHEHANEVAVFLGGTTESSATHFTIGAEYERRLGERFGLSFVCEHVSDTGAWVFLAPFTVRPVRTLGLKVYAGPGFESKVPEASEEHAAEGSEKGGRESVFVARTGVGWALELKRVSLTPQVEVDFAHEHDRWEKALVFGVAIGVGF